MSGFVLLPLRQAILEGKLPSWPDAELAVLPVLIAHENAESRVANPCQDRIRVLAGLSKRNVPDAVNSLESSGWFEVVRIPTARGRVRTEYRMKYRRYERGDGSGNWLRIERDLIMCGVWAAMPPGCRRLYLVLHSLSWGGQVAAYRAEAPEGGPFLDEEEAQEYGRFTEAPRLIPGDLRRLAGIEPRTFTRAWAWLLQWGIVVPSEEGEHGGIFLPHDPGFEVPEIMERLKRCRGDLSAPGGRAKNLMRRSYRITRQDTIGNRTRLNGSRTRVAPSSDTREPEQVLEQVLEQAPKQVLNKNRTSRANSDRGSHECVFRNGGKCRSRIEYPEEYEAFWKAFKQHGCAGSSVKMNGYKVPALPYWQRCKEAGMSLAGLIERLRHDGGDARTIEVSPIVWLRDALDGNRTLGGAQ